MRSPIGFCRGATPSMRPPPDSAPRRDHGEDAAMNLSAQIQDGFHRWIDSVAGTLNGLLDRLRSKREVRLIEEDDDTFVLHVEGGTEGSGGNARRGPGNSPSLPDHRIRIANGAIEGA